MKRRPSQMPKAQLRQLKAVRAKQSRDREGAVSDSPGASKIMRIVYVESEGDGSYRLLYLGVPGPTGDPLQARCTSIRSVKGRIHQWCTKYGKPDSFDFDPPNTDGVWGRILGKLVDPLATSTP